MSVTPGQALLLFGLLARHGACPQADLMPKVTKADRETLVKARLVATGKAGRGIGLALTDAGWGWAAENLSAELPAPHRALSDLLRRLGEHLARSGETLAEVIGEKPENPAAIAERRAAAEKAQAARERLEAKEAQRRASAEKKRIADEARLAKARAREEKQRAAVEAKAATERAKIGKGSKAGRSGKPKPPTPAALRKRIEAAYLAITDGAKDRSVMLARLRSELPDLDRETVDAGLGRILAGDKKASLMRHDDPRQLGKADHDAAFDPAGEPFHVLWIAS